MNPETRSKKVRVEKKAAPKSYGPVPDLEELVPPDWWKKLFDSYYLRTDSDVVTDEELTANEVDLILQQTGLSPQSRILDLCCGQGRHTFEFYRRGFENIQGLDRSAYLIQKARKDAQKQNIAIRFREGDARKLPWKQNELDTVMLLGNSFGYFEQAHDDTRVLSEIYRVLVPGGKLVLDITDGDFLRTHYEPRSWEWLDQNHFVCRERQLSEDSQRLISREVICPTPEAVRIAEPRRIQVLLGDPRRTDRIKPAQVFDEDDFDTIRQLHTNLEGLADFSFSYLDDHDRMVEELVRQRGRYDLVFNLCDEGFENDPFKELHVPALLDMLHIPYTGAEPKCLATCYDKSLVRGAAQEMGIRVPRAAFIEQGRDLNAGSQQQPNTAPLVVPAPFPVPVNLDKSPEPASIPLPGIIKPNWGDSSYGIDQSSLVYSEADLEAALEKTRARYDYNGAILVEEFLSGAEITVGIIGNPPGPYTVLPVIQEDYSRLPEGLPPICGYEAKWQPDSPYWQLRSIPVDLPEEVHNKLVDDCVRLFVRLGCRDYCRFDWRLNAEGVPHLLEANPNPGWCWDGHLAKMANLAGMTYQDMLKAILDAAFERTEKKPADAEESLYAGIRAAR